MRVGASAPTPPSACPLCPHWRPEGPPRPPGSLGRMVPAPGTAPTTSSGVSKGCAPPPEGEAGGKERERRGFLAPWAEPPHWAQAAAPTPEPCRDHGPGVGWVTASTAWPQTRPISQSCTPPDPLCPICMVG